MQNSQKWVWPALIAALLVGLICGVVIAGLFAGGGAEEEAAAGGAPQGPPPASVKIGVVEMQTLQDRVPVIGRLQEIRRVAVTAEVEGKIVEMAVDEGDKVTGGETVIARIDETWAKLAVTSAEADVAAAEAEVSQSGSDLKQLQQLRDAGSARAKEVEDKQTLVDANRARLAAAKAALDRARTELERATIVAPFDGAVSRKMVEVGQWVDPGAGVIEMISTGEIDAVVDVPERYISEVQIGDQVEVMVEALGQAVVGKVVSVRPDGVNASRTFPVKIRLPDMDQRLRAGLSVVAKVPVSREKQFITVPRDSILFKQSGAEIWYAAEMGGPMPQALSEPVNMLFGVDDRYAVEPLPGAPRPALQQGTKVVIEGADRLFPTQPLNIVNPDSADQPPAGSDAAAASQSGA